MTFKGTNLKKTILLSSSILRISYQGTDYNKTDKGNNRGQSLLKRCLTEILNADNSFFLYNLKAFQSWIRILNLI